MRPPGKLFIILSFHKLSLPPTGTGAPTYSPTYSPSSPTYSSPEAGHASPAYSPSSPSYSPSHGTEDEAPTQKPQ